MNLHDRAANLNRLLRRIEALEQELSRTPLTASAQWVKNRKDELEQCRRSVDKLQRMKP